MGTTVLRKPGPSVQGNRDRDPLAVLLHRPRGHGSAHPPYANPTCPRGPAIPDQWPEEEARRDSGHTDAERSQQSQALGSVPSRAQEPDKAPAISAAGSSHGSRLKALSDATLEVGSQLDEGELLRSVVSSAVALVQATAGVLYLRDPHGESLARISHRLSAASTDRTVSAALRLVGLLTVSPRIRLRGPRSQALQPQPSPPLRYESR
jgi:hypothetical protein